jgi:hypothetical protein
MAEKLEFVCKYVYSAQLGPQELFKPYNVATGSNERPKVSSLYAFTAN